MSFGDINPPQTPTTPATAPHPSPHPLTQLQGSLNALAANTQALRRLSTLLQTPQPTPSTSLKQIRDLREQTRDIAHAASTLAARLDHAEQRARFHALLDDFSMALKESVVAEQVALQGMREVVRMDDGSGVAVEEMIKGREVGTETEPLLAARGGREEAMLREVRMNDGLVRERNVALSEIRASVEDVNAIFKDLAVMVGEQNEQVEYVEVAVAEAAFAVDRGGRELGKTQRRRERRKGVFFCALLSIALVIALMVIIVLS